MVYGIIRSRAPSRKPFRIPLFLNETRLPSALTKAAANDHRYNKVRRLGGQTACSKTALKDAAPCCFYCSRKMIRAFVKSYGDSSTDTLSPGTIRMKCLRILPEI